VTFLTHAQPTGYDREGRTRVRPKAMNGEEKKAFLKALRQKDECTTVVEEDKALEELLTNMMAPPAGP